LLEERYAANAREQGGDASHRPLTPVWPACAALWCYRAGWGRLRPV